jgi:hypothetical protein
MKKDAPVAAMRIAAPVASEVKKRRKTIFYFCRKLTSSSTFLLVINGS